MNPKILVYQSPDADCVSQHANAVLHDVNLRVGRIDPLHRKIHHAVPKSLSQEQHLNVKGEAIDLLKLEHFPCSALSEGFEAALGIRKWRERQRTEDSIEGLPH